MNSTSADATELCTVLAFDGDCGFCQAAMRQMQLRATSAGAGTGAASDGARTAIAPATPGIRAAPITDRPIMRLLFAATRHTQTASPTTTAVIAELRTAAQQGRTTPLPPA
ncbi:MULTISPECIES: hypothetical protein [unclassified Streptomyces]|uniref:hypothetical protein n=1 Tax=unclassified Streptomyces TaxID=2593676 RepID=UPI00380DF28D